MNFLENAKVIDFGSEKEKKRSKKIEAEMKKKGTNYVTEADFSLSEPKAASPAQTILVALYLGYVFGLFGLIINGVPGYIGWIILITVFVALVHLLFWGLSKCSGCGKRSFLLIPLSRKDECPECDKAAKKEEKT